MPNIITLPSILNKVKCNTCNNILSKDEILEYGNICSDCHYDLHNTNEILDTKSHIPEVFADCTKCKKVITLETYNNCNKQCITCYNSITIIIQNPITIPIHSL